jgi:lipopolysaccharide export system protein LptA
MFDSRKIDAYFNDPDSLNRPKTAPAKPAISGWQRFVKLGFPCLAAALIGVVMVLPNIKKSVDLQNNITMPRKNEMEKLHVEQTVFSMTDSKNRVNYVTADSLDETEPGSQKVKIVNPHATIPTDKGEILLSSQEGLFNQQTNVLELFNDVHAVVNETTDIKTQSAAFDFNTDIGHGNEHIDASGDWGTLQADAWTFDKKTNVLTLTGHSVVTAKNGVVTAEKENIWYNEENKIVSIGDVVMTQGQNKIKADKIVTFITAKEPRELLRLEAYGNVKITTPQETATGAEAVYDVTQNRVELFGQQKSGKVLVTKGNNKLTASKMVVYLQKGSTRQIDHIDALGGVHIQTPKGSAQGNRGVYKPQKSLVELWDNVLIEQDGNFVRGGHAETDLKTSVSRITGKQKGERISGTLYKKRKADNGHKEK